MTSCLVVQHNLAESARDDEDVTENVADVPQREHWAEVAPAQRNLKLISVEMVHCLSGRNRNM